MGKSWGPKTNVRVNNRESVFPEEFWDDPNEITQSLEKYEEPVEADAEAKPKNTVSNILISIGLILIGIALIGGGISLMGLASL